VNGSFSHGARGRVSGHLTVATVSFPGGSAGPPHLARDLKTVGQTLVEQLAKSCDGTVVLLDLGQVLLRASELGVLLADPVHAIVNGEYPGRYLVVGDGEGQNVWDADAALKKESDARGQSLALAWRVGTEARTLVGRVDPLIRDTYEFVSSASSPSDATARKLAEIRNVTVQAASNRLSRVSRLGLAHAIGRVSAAGGGSQYIYIVVS